MIKGLLVVLFLLTLWGTAVSAEPMGVLKIPSIGVYSPIVQTAMISLPNRAGTWDFTGLGDKVAHLEGSKWVNEGDNIALSGHVDQVFMKLDQVRMGDSIFIILPDQTVVEYRVIDRYIQRRPIILYTSFKEQLTIVTCYDWNGHEWANRLVVIAERVS